MFIHYIYINSSNINETTNDSIQSIKEIHNKHYTFSNATIKYHTYADIIKLLNEYDKELCFLFKQINTNYAALLADIGRYIILYKYGGVYHDLKCMSDYNIESIYENIKDTLIGEICPNEPHRVRNTNIMVKSTKHPFIDIVLHEIKNKLIKGKITNIYGSRNMFLIGSHTYISLFEIYSKKMNIIEKRLDNFITINKDIYHKKKLKKWQNTEEYIFK